MGKNSLDHIKVEFFAVIDMRKNDCFNDFFKTENAILSAKLKFQQNVVTKCLQRYDCSYVTNTVLE